MDGVVSIEIPGSKSVSHRAVICASLAHGRSHLGNVLESVDLSRTIEVLGACGADINRLGYGEYLIDGLGGAPMNVSGGPVECYMGESGSTCRLLTPVLAAGCGPFMVSGKEGLYRRPIGELVDALRSLGADINYIGERAKCPPLMINASGLHVSGLPDGEICISSDLSSQYMSGLLLAAPLAYDHVPGGQSRMLVRLGGTSPVSWPYVGLTLRTMAVFGVNAEMETLDESGVWQSRDWLEHFRTEQPRPGELRFRVPPARYAATDFTILGDWSTASYFLAAGAIGPRPVRVNGMNLQSLQGDIAILGILRRMGARLETGENFVIAYPGPLRGIDLDMGHWPDLVPTVLAVAAHASGVTVLRNIAHLQVKESDRISAMSEALRKTGCSVERIYDKSDEGDGLMVTPPPGGPVAQAADAPFRSHNDHRIAMACCLLGLAAPQRLARGFTAQVDDRECVEKSFPGFWAAWRQVTG